MPWKQGYTISDEITIADKDLRWPEGKRCCFTLVVDLSVASGPEGITEADLTSPEAQFAAHDGLTELTRLLQRTGFRATFAVPAVTAEIQAGAIRELQAAGHEIAANGLKHEDVSRLDRAEEQRQLALTTEILEQILGQRPAGWYGLPRQEDPFATGTISTNTVDLLLDAGYEYLGNSLADDAPHWWVTDFATRRALLAMPYYYHFDDQFFLLFPRAGSGLENPDFLFRNLKLEFEAQHRRGRFFTTTLHPVGVGWCNRLQLLSDFLTYVRGFGDVWNPTAVECARYWRETYPANTHLRLEPSIWQDYPGSLS